jgi:hypothetical protein
MKYIFSTGRNVHISKNAKKFFLQAYQGGIQSHSFYSRGNVALLTAR